MNLSIICVMQWNSQPFLLNHHQKKQLIQHVSAVLSAWTLQKLIRLALQII
jgi:hypothetical protein